MNNLHVALVQPDLVWLNPDENLKHLASLLAELPEQTELAVLPEMFTSGFTEKPESVAGGQRALQWMLEQAKKLNIAIVGSIAWEIAPNKTKNINKHYVNRLLFVDSDGLTAYYDKCHLFQMGGEHLRYQAGTERRIISYKGWRLLLTVCYDLRFPVFCRNCNDYDVMLCVANWPEPRRYAWRTLLLARSIENQAYIVGVNRVGIDGNGLEYVGDSMVVDVQGYPLADGHDGKECVLAATLSADDLLRARRSFPVWKDADSFQLL